MSILNKKKYNEEKKLAVIFTTSHQDTIGNHSRLVQIKFLINKFRVDVFTNQIEFIQLYFPDVEVYGLPIKKCQKIPIINKLVFWRRTALFLNNSNNHIVFLYHDDAAISIWLKKPSFIFIHQLKSSHSI